MSENRDETTGQFATDPGYGREGIERSQGWTQFKGDKPEIEEVTIEEAAKELADRRTPENEIKTFTTGLPDNVSMTLDQAAQARADGQAADQAELDDQQAEAIRREVDDLRGVDQQQEKTAESPKPDEPSTPEADIQKLLEMPHVKEAVERLTGEAETVKSSYNQALNAAHQIAQAAFAEKFPEVAGLPVEQWEGALVAMAQREPARFKQAFSSLSRINEIQVAHEHQHQQAEQKRLAELTAYAKAESAKFEESIKNVPKAQRAAIESNIVQAIKEHGGDIDVFVKLMQSSEFASATVQSLLWEVGQYRQIMKAKESLRPDRRPLPPVQRPGVVQPRSSVNDSSIDALQRQFASAASTQQQMRIGAQLLAAQRRSRG